MIHDINDICLTICDHTIYGVPPMFVRTRSHSFACLLLLNTEQNRQQFTIYYLPTQNHYTDKCKCLYDKKHNTLTAKSLGVGERHCPCSAIKGLGVHRNTTTQKVQNGQSLAHGMLISQHIQRPCTYLTDGGKRSGQTCPETTSH